ncbi:MAG: recombinase family protein [Ruminococcaceae bacterium]|nr:recombinase family protein [Oscillospiraceae bacterium]
MKAWLYYRLSRDEDEEMNSLQNQRQILLDYAKQNGYEIVGESFDDNVSGMTFNRKGLGELESAVDEGKVEAVLVKDLSRLGRHRTQTALFIDHLRENNVKVISVTEGIDTTNENDDLLIGFKQIFNDFYAKDIGKKVRAGIRQKQKTGLVVNLPMGYYKDKNTGEVLIDETAAEIVREAFQRYIGGHGITAIARDFNNRGIKSPEYFSHRKISSTRTEMCKKFLWAQTTVKRLLQNESYAGTLVNHKTSISKIYHTRKEIPNEERYRHEDFLPPIIDRQTWEQAQILLEQRPKSNVGAGRGRIIHRYSGLIKCGDCGAILIAKRREWQGREYVEYTCNSHHRYGKQYCTPHRIHQSQLDQIVYDGLQKLRDKVIAESEEYEKIIKDWVKKKPLYEKNIKRYTEKIAALKNQIEDLILERIGDREHADVYNSMITKRETEITELEQKIADNQKYDEVSRQKRDSLKSTSELLNEIISSGNISDANLRMLVNKVHVYNDEDGGVDVVVEFNGEFNHI